MRLWDVLEHGSLRKPKKQVLTLALLVLAPLDILVSLVLQCENGNSRDFWSAKIICVADRVLVLWPGFKPVPLRWES